MHAKPMSINQLKYHLVTDQRVVSLSAHPFTPTPTSNKHFCIHIRHFFLNCSRARPLLIWSCYVYFPYSRQSLFFM